MLPNYFQKSLFLTGISILLLTKILLAAITEPQDTATHSAYMPLIAAKTVRHVMQSFEAGRIRLDSPRSLTWKKRRDEKSGKSEITFPGNIKARMEPFTKTVASISLKNDQAIFSYDAQDLLLSAENSNMRTEFEYYADSRLAGMRIKDFPALQYLYNTQGQLREMRIGNISLQYQYDFQGRLSAIRTPVGTISYQYRTGQNMVIRTLPNGIKTYQERNDQGQLAAIQHVDAQNKILSSFEYQYRSDGLLQNIRENNRQNGDIHYTNQYDPMLRLASVAINNAESYNYQYDKLGNLLNQNNNGKQLIFTNAETGMPLSDSRGTLKTDNRGFVRELPSQNGNIDYQYNMQGLLASSRNDSVRYAYNALGQLISRTVQGQKTNYLPDPLSGFWKPIWTRKANGSESLIIWDGHTPLMEINSNQATYYLEDNLGSVRLTLDHNGKPVSWHRYTPYGELQSATATEELTSQFSGLYWDPIAQIYLTQARAYHPISARFLQPDPQIPIPGVSKQTHSLYAYCGGDPVNYVDLNGENAEELNTIYPDIEGFDPVSYFLQLFSNSDMHTKRNSENRLPSGQLKPVKNAKPDFKYKGWDHKYIDEGGLIWTQVHPMLNIFHPQNSIKFVAPRPGGGEYEAIMLNSEKAGEGFAKWSVTGPNQSTLNYGMHFEHLLFDILPHFLNHNYYSYSNQDINYPNYQPYPQKVDAANNIREQQASHLQPSPNKNDFPRSDDQNNYCPGCDQGPPGGGGGGFDNFNSGNGTGSGLFKASPLAPSPVGGINLKDAAQALENMGPLQGVALDESNGRLVLIGADKKNIALPPLPLDEIVTVFRAVYLYGESPSVSIDPDPASPQGPVMLVRHGPGTANTYVGWVLFECDRIMKAYQLGVDNISREPLQTRITGYEDMLNLIFSRDLNKPVLERFWIVPALQRRYDEEQKKISLWEIPLKVNTQVMHWQNGKLMDQENAASSAYARGFSRWFSEHYDAIAEEIRLQPPAGSDLREPVAIFQELKRIAMLTAIAEKLRNQGTPLPIWMQDYPLKPFPVAENTPALTSQRKSGISQMRIYGGVDLAPADKDVHVYNNLQNTSSQNSESLTFVNNSQTLTQTIASVMNSTEFLSSGPTATQAIEQASQQSLQATILPGANTQALAPNRQSATDMEVPYGLGQSLRLVRHYNSFFNADGELGKGWTLNLPKLNVTNIPVTRDGKQVQYRTVLQLTDALGSFNVRFDKSRNVTPYNVEMFTNESRSDIAGVICTTSPLIGKDTWQIHFRDGHVWHFDAENGKLLLQQNSGMSILYNRNSMGQIFQIAGYLGQQVAADIQLSYDSQGHIIKAQAQQAGILARQNPARFKELTFIYNPDGQLQSVVSCNSANEKAELWKYTYEAPRLTSISGNSLGSTPVLTFGYNEQAQLLWVKKGEQTQQFAFLSTAGGPGISQASASGKEHWQYDWSMRPVQYSRDSTHQVTWTYGKDNEQNMTVIQNHQKILQIQTSADGQKETWKWPEGVVYEIQRDAYGQPAIFRNNGDEVYTIKRNQDGSIRSVIQENREIQPRHHPDGWQNGLLMSAPLVDGETQQWLKMEWNPLGKVTQVTDAMGLNYQINYDSLGRIQSTIQKKADGNILMDKYSYNEQGKLVSHQTPWSYTQMNYGTQGMLKEVNQQSQGSSAYLSLTAEGNPEKMIGFYGATTLWRYTNSTTTSTSQLAAIVLPNQVIITYPQTLAKDPWLTKVIMEKASVLLSVDKKTLESTISWGAL